GAGPAAPARPAAPPASPHPRRYGLPIVATQRPPDEWYAEHGIEGPAPGQHVDTAAWPVACVGEASYVNSRSDSLVLDGERTVAEAKAMTNAWLEQRGEGE